MMRFSFLTAIAVATAFANANAGSKLYIATVNADPDNPDPQQTALNQAAFEALDWTQIAAVGSHGEVGSQTNILTYDTWDTDVIQKAKGMTDAGSPEIELARVYNDNGQIALRLAAATNLNYAFKIERNDEFEVGGSPTIIYNRGLVTGPRRPMGRNEDFDLEIFTLALQQREIVVDPAAAP